MSAGGDGDVRTELAVLGMTCEHCVRSVSEEIAELDGVLGVDVDLSTGSVVVTSTHPLDAGTLRAAVDAAGYTLA